MISHDITLSSLTEEVYAKKNMLTDRKMIAMQMKQIKCTKGESGRNCLFFSILYRRGFCGL